MQGEKITPRDQKALSGRGLRELWLLTAMIYLVCCTESHCRPSYRRYLAESTTTTYVITDRRRLCDTGGPIHLKPQPHRPVIMAEWRPPFERGVSNFRLGKYDEALACFNEV